MSPDFRRLIVPGMLGIALTIVTPLPSHARVIPIPADFRVGPPQGGMGDGLDVRFKDVGSGCTLQLIKDATDTVSVQITTRPWVNFLLNQGCNFDPFPHGCGYFETRWDSYLDIRAPGDYVFSMQVDDQATIAIGDSTILELEGGHWFANVTSDTVHFEETGSYPFRAYYADCQPCCRGFRLGGMGPPGSGMMAFSAGFDFNTDLGPCCTYGSNGPGVSLVPAELFFRTSGTVSVEPGVGSVAAGTILRCWASPNPSRGEATLAVELSRGQQVWTDVFDSAGRRIASLAHGEWRGPGVARWVWSPGGSSPAARASGTYFFRVRTSDGSRARGQLAITR